MTEKQRLFCEYYIKSFNATEAAKKAGYSEKTAYSIGQQLLKKIEIQKYFNTLREKSQSETILNVEDLKIMLSNTVRDTTLKISARLKAAELLGKHYGLFTENINLTGTNAINIENNSIDISLIFPYLPDSVLTEIVELDEELITTGTLENILKNGKEIKKIDTVKGK